MQIFPGRGLSARVEGHDCLLGNEALFSEFSIALPLDVAAPEPGVTRLWMALDGAAAGVLRCARCAAARCGRGRCRVAPRGPARADADRRLSRRCRAHCAQAGITEVEAGLDPAGKLARIRALQQSGLRVAMVGDGINDAAALAQADAGIAMGTGADLAQEAGDVLLLRTQPSAIPAALALARQTLRIMRQNLGWAVGYNLLGIPLAAGVLYPAFHILLTPWLAAAAMALSSVCVLGNSLRLRGWQPAPSPASQHAKLDQSLLVRILTRYILGEILSLTLIGCALFTFILFMPQLPHILEVVVRSSSTWADVAEVFLFTLPNLFKFTIPMAVLWGMLLGLSRLAADSEIIAMRASGLGIGYFVRVVSIVAVDGHAAGPGQLALSRAARQPGHPRDGAVARDLAGLVRDSAARLLRGLSATSFSMCRTCAPGRARPTGARSSWPTSAIAPIPSSPRPPPPPWSTTTRRN